MARKFMAASIDKLTISFHNATTLSKLFNVIAIGLGALALTLICLAIVFYPEIFVSGYYIWVLLDIGTSFSVAQAWAFREAYKRFHVAGTY